jgi:hypothetical protein
MKLLSSLKTGILRSARSWKGVLIVWIVSLVMVSMIALPMKASFKNDLGGSMITEKLKAGINLDVFADLGSDFTNLSSYFSKGLIILMVAGFLINSFFSGGLFSSLKARQTRFSTNDFFRASSNYFWSFLVISFSMSLLIIISGFLIVVAPVCVMSQGRVISDYIVFGSGVILTSVFIFVLIVILLATDYARAWQVIQTKNVCFKAIWFGFSQSFRTFYSSYPLMLILVIIQTIYMWPVLTIISGLKPATFGGIVLLFLLSQLLFVIRILLKTWRYGSVTRMMELNTLPGFISLDSV